MQELLAPIKKMIGSVIDIDSKEWAYYSAMFTIKEIRKKEVLLKADEICRNVYFVNKGLLRIFFTDKSGKESTFHFTQQYELATDYESLLQGTPSKYHIQALEDSQVVVWSAAMIADGYQKLRYGDRLARIITEKHFIAFSNKIQAMYTQTHMERYRQMNLRFPNILQKVPQHYIASYLNISPVHLSRLKSESE